MHRRRVVIALAVIALCVLVVPFPRLECPDWDVWVLDEHGNAVENMVVRLSYQDYTLESSGHEETKITGLSGHVRFGAKKTISTVGLNIIGVLRSTFESGVHASYGPSAYVMVFGKGWEEVFGQDTTNWLGDSSSNAISGQG